MVLNILSTSLRLRLYFR